MYVVTFPHTYPHILVPAFTGNLNLNFKILSEQKEFLHSLIFRNICWVCLPETLLFLHLNRLSKLITKLFHKQVFVKSLLGHASGDALICSVASPILIKNLILAHNNDAATPVMDSDGRCNGDGDGAGDGWHNGNGMAAQWQLMT